MIKIVLCSIFKSMKRVAVWEGAAIGRQAVWLLGGGRGVGRNFLEGVLRKLRIQAGEGLVGGGGSVGRFVGLDGHHEPGFILGA